MASRDESEVVLAIVVEESTKTFLQQVLDAVMSAIRAGRYDEAQPVLALGVMLGWWTDQVGDRVVESIKEAWQAAYGVTLAGQDIVTARADAMAFHIAAVRDRLSRSALPEIPEAAFDEVRLSQSSAALGGWNIEQQARDIAERLKWEPEKQYWKDQKQYAEDQIDKILDPLGKPGSPARTYAHKHDPEVKHWQKVRAGAVDKLREDQGDWQTRSERIARTEATAAWNSGTLAALAAEGRTHKKWVATKDPRTRESHREANGQVVRLSRPFTIGEALLMMPGDPAAPPWETINCRCTVVGADEPAKKALTAAGGIDQARVPKGNGRLSGRWLDMPGRILDDLSDLFSGERRHPLPSIEVEAQHLKQGDGVLLNDEVHEVTEAGLHDGEVLLKTRQPSTGKEQAHKVEKKSKWRKVLMALSAVALLGGLTFGGINALDGPDREPVQPQETTSQVVEQEVKAPAPTTVQGYRDMFKSLDSGEWGAADVSISRELPDGRRIWLYGDTLSGDNGFVHSTAIVQDGGELNVSNGGKQLLPDDPDSPDGRKNIYWIEQARVKDDGTVLVYAAPTSIGTDSVWDFHRSDDRSRVAEVSVDADGNAHFEGWLGYKPIPADSMVGSEGMTILGPNHFTYQDFTHDIKLESGKYLHTVAQNWDDAFQNHMNPDGTLRYSDFAPIFSATGEAP